MKLDQLINKLKALQDEYGNVEVLVSSDGEGNWISELTFVQQEKGIYDREEMDYHIIAQEDLPDYEGDTRLKDYIVIWP